MSDETTRIQNRYTRIYVNSGFIGFILGIIYVAIFLMVSWLWSGAYDHLHYSMKLESLNGTSNFILALFVPVAAGILAVVLSSEHIRGYVSAILSGAFAGILLAASAMAASLASYIFLSSQALFAYSLCYIIYVLIAGVSAFIFYALTTLDIDDDYNVKIKKNKVNKRAVIIAICTLLVLIAFIPPVVANIGVDAGWIRRQPHDGIFANVGAEKLSDGSIKITDLGSPTDYWLDEDSVFTIIVNGRNVTNIDAINKEGLSLSIAPAEGLRPQAGSSVIISGKDIGLLGREGSTAHIVLFAKDKDGWSYCVMDTALKL
jgi:hypothetical protein